MLTRPSRTQGHGRPGAVSQPRTYVLQARSLPSAACLCLRRHSSARTRSRRGAAAAVIVFDITNVESLGKAKTWVKELQRQGSPNMIMALAGNKADLGESRAVTSEEAQAGSWLQKGVKLCATDRMHSTLGLS